MFGAGDKDSLGIRLLSGFVYFCTITNCMNILYIHEDASSFNAFISKGQLLPAIALLMSLLFLLGTTGYISFLIYLLLLLSLIK